MPGNPSILMPSATKTGSAQYSLVVYFNLIVEVTSPFALQTKKVNVSNMRIRILNYLEPVKYFINWARSYIVGLESFE